MQFPSGPGAVGGPISPDAWKRAVYRIAPPRFYIEMLSPVKQGGSYSYGMRICPMRGEDCASISSRAQFEYDIWRRWEDCLYFQETLEVEYSRMSREKRQRLFAGKGIKKNGVYIHDQAASFESLPPGPDPHSIAENIHDFVPKLTKKGTLFRASQATVDQRQKELQAIIDGLFQEDAPTLIRELRSSRTVTDFFGFWRRDYDLARKNDDRARIKPRGSISGSVFSSYFTSSNPNFSSSLADVPPSPTLPSPRSPGFPPSRSDKSIIKMASSSRLSTATSHRSSSDDESLFPTQMSSSSSTSSRSSSTPSSRRASIHSNVPIYMGSDTLSTHRDHADQRPSSGLASLPEDSELASPAPINKSSDDAPSPVRRTRRVLDGENRLNRNFRVLSSSLHSPDLDSEDTSIAESCSTSPARHSWQTTASGVSIPASYLADLDVTLPEESLHRSRASISSLASFMTTSSADAVIPRHDILGHNRTPFSVPEDSGGEDDGFLDCYLYDTFAQRASSPTATELAPITPIGDFPSSISTSSSDNLSGLFSDRTSISTSTSLSLPTTPVTPTFPGSLTLKAAHGASIVLLRVSRDVCLMEVRQKLYDKFVGQEGMFLSDAFVLALVLPSGARARSNSLSSSIGSDLAVMHMISSERDWEGVVALGMGKLSLRVFDGAENVVTRSP